MKKKAFVSLNASFISVTYVCRTKCLLIGYIYVACIMDVAYKNLSIKLDYSQMPLSRSGFDSNAKHFMKI